MLFNNVVLCPEIK